VHRFPSQAAIRRNIENDKLYSRSRQKYLSSCTDFKSHLLHCDATLLLLHLIPNTAKSTHAPRISSESRHVCSSNTHQYPYPGRLFCPTKQSLPRDYQAHDCSIYQLNSSPNERLDLQVHGQNIWKLDPLDPSIGISLQPIPPKQALQFLDRQERFQPRILILMPYKEPNIRIIGLIP